MKNLTIIAIAMVCHEANRAYCQSIGDDSQPRWEDAPEWQKESAVNGVKFSLSRLGGADYGPEASHANWMAEKAAQGWKYGPKKDPDAKEHPCMVPYDELPAEQRMKDHIFAGIVRSMTALGLPVDA